MNKFSELLTSRKFLLTIGGVMTNLGMAMEGKVEWQTSIMAISGLVVAWVLAQGRVDASKTANPTVDGGDF